jgi:hypothetical protein
MALKKTSVRPCRVLSRSQRETLALIRAGRDAERADSHRLSVDLIPGSFVRLARACTVHEIPMNGERSPYVTSGECILLAALAVLQRPLLAALLDGSPLRRELAACSSVLAADGVRLSLTTMGWALLVEHGWVNERMPVKAARVADRRRAALGAQLPSPEGGLRHKAVSLATGRDTITTAEFRKIGISRQMLSIICADGLFERVRFGEYRLAATLRPPASGCDVTT